MDARKLAMRCHPSLAETHIHPQAHVPCTQFVTLFDGPPSSNPTLQTPVRPSLDLLRAPLVSCHVVSSNPSATPLLKPTLSRCDPYLSPFLRHRQQRRRRRQIESHGPDQTARHNTMQHNMIQSQTGRDKTRHSSIGPGSGLYVCLSIQSNSMSFHCRGDATLREQVWFGLAWPVEAVAGIYLSTY